MTNHTISETATAQTGEPVDLLRAASGRVPCIFHRTPDTTLVGLGVAAACEAKPGESLRQLDERLRARLREAAGDDVPENLHLFFQVAFDPDRPGEEPWSAFGRVRMIAPRATLRWQEGRLTTARLGSNAPDDLFEAAVGEPDEPASGDGLDLQVDWPETEAYRAGVRRVIEAGGLDKAVIARTAEVTADRPFDPNATVAALARRHPDARLFCLSPGPEAPTFVGASPERLIRLEGTRAETMALAGTADRRDRDPKAAAEALLGSAKDRDEHGYVTRMIVETLERLGAEVETPEVPRPVVLPDLVHLETPITARMPDDHRIVDLVDALHPTPAVCGTPTDAARHMIREVEPFDRGLYAGALGWTDRAGNGDVTVALRCGLIDGRRARLYAGGGITADSTVADEAAETKSKIAPMLTALREGLA